MMTGMLAACSNNPGGETGTTAAPAVTSATVDTPETTEAIPENQKDTLGDHNFGGTTFTILSRTLTSYEYIGDDSTGDVVKTSVAKRNMDVEGRLGVKIEVVEAAGNWGDRDSFISKVKTAYSTGSKVYDMVSTHSAYIVNIGLSGYSYNMNELPGIDFSKKWWCPQYTDNVLIDGAIYSAVGDGGYTLYEYTMCTFFNKTLQAAYSIPDIYSIVESGDWTYEKMLEFAYLVSEDKNGSGKPDTGDVFGMSMTNHNARMCQTVWDTQMTVADENGHQTINLNNERYIAAYEKLYDTVYKNNQYCIYASEGANLTTEFTQDHILFFTEKLLEAAKMRDMDSEYGIVPFPKFDKDQQNYISSARDAMSAISIMRNIDNPELVGCVTEALAMYGWMDITPAYYETTLKYRYMSDPVAVSMLDLIRDTMRFDFAMTYTNAIDLIYALMGDQLQAQTANISIQIKAKTKKAQTAIEKIYTDYAAIK